ncbi:hypothetical protein ACKWTF_012752 [Chironomus riparius]
MIRQLFLAIAIGFACSEACTINFGQMRKNEPIFLYNTNNNINSFMIPNGNSMTLSSGTQFLIDCGQGRKFNIPNQNIQQLQVSCENNAFMIGNQLVQSVDNFECMDARNSPVVRIQKTQSICGDDGLIYNVGFHVQNGNSQNFIQVLQSCFDEQSKSVFYVKSNIFGQVDRSGSPDFSINNGVWTDGKVVPSNFFEVKSVKSAFSTKQFHRGHYAPNADYPFAQHRRATFQYFNMGPMEARFNGKDWSQLESYVRKLVKHHGQTATVFTGGFVYNSQSALASKNRPINILNQNPQGNKVMMPGNQVKTILVPDLFWKIINIGNQGVAIFMFNDTTITQQNFCQNLCQKYFCCNVNEFISGTDGIKGNFNWPQDAYVGQNLGMIPE